MKRGLIFTTLVWISCSVLAINAGNISFENLSTDQGLSQSDVEKIFQDSRGFIWFGTHDGLNRYDGRNFETFRNQRGDSTSLYSNKVFAINEDESGNVWIGTNGGLNIYEYHYNRFKRVPESDHFPGGRINCISPEYNNEIFIGTNVGLAIYNTVQSSFRLLNDFPGGMNQQGANDNVYDVEITTSGRIFIARHTDPIYEYHQGTDSFTEINYKSEYFGNNYKKSIASDGNGNLYIASEEAKVFVYNISSGTSELLSGINVGTVKTKIMPLTDSEVWIGTDGGGVNIYNPQNKTFKVLRNNTKIDGSISGNAIFDLFEDTHGNIWIGHYGAGVSVWKKHKEKFKSYSHNPFNEYSLNKEVVTAIFEDSKGRIWIGQDGGGLNLLLSEKQGFKHFRHQPGVEGSLGTNVIISINEDPFGNLLLGTYSGGMMVFNPESEQVVKTFTTENGLASNHVWQIYIDSKQRYWLGVLGAGVNVYDPYTETFKHYNIHNTEHEICSNVVMHFAEDDQGNIWMGAEYGGICVLNPDNGFTKNYSYDQININSISANDVKSILFLGDYAWIGTVGGGLNRIDLKTDSVKVYNTSSGLSSNSIMSIMADEDKNLWISSTKGLMKFYPEQERVEIFDKTQGLQSNEFKYNAKCMLSDGQMAFGGVDGISVFDPQSIKPSTVIPSLILTDLKVFNQSVIVGNGLLEQHINEQEQIKLKHKHRLFSLEFASLDYTSPAKNQYRYMLEGFDDEWITSATTSATYTNLPPGKYVFKLQATNSDGVWSGEELQLQIRKRPPFYRTRVFILFMLLFITLAVIAVIRSRMAKVKHDKLILQQKIDEGQEELDKRIAEIEHQKQEIIDRENREKELRFSNRGIVKFSEIISRNRDNINELATEVISTLTDYVEANAGVIYFSEDDEQKASHLKLVSGYCYDSQNKNGEEILPGEGYVGTCFLSKEVIYVDDMPEGKVMLSSGLGEYSVRNIVYIPILNNDECLGILEVASLKRLEAYKITFIQKIAESIGSVLAIEKANRNTKVMLQQNQQQAEVLLSQEEELRQNLEEMKATQEEVERKLANMETLKAELEAAQLTIKQLKTAKAGK